MPSTSVMPASKIGTILISSQLEAAASLLQPRGALCQVYLDSVPFFGGYFCCCEMSCCCCEVLKAVIFVNEFTMHADVMVDPVMTGISKLRFPYGIGTRLHAR